jgi:hypothetical protein
LASVLNEPDIAVAGIGTTGRFPPWIKDLRTGGNVTENIERTWCQRYAASHAVIGIHGSNMLLPSALAGMTFDLMPADRWGNLMQDILPVESDGRMACLRYSLLPLDIDLDALSHIVKERLLNYPLLDMQMSATALSHEASGQAYDVARRRVDAFDYAQAMRHP